MSKYYPIFLDMALHAAVVIGGGKIGFGKAEQLLECQSKVTVISPEFNPEFEKIKNNENLTLIQKKYKEGDLEGFTLAIAATDSPEVNQQIFDDGKKSKTLVNVVDSPIICDFIAPSVVQRGSFKIAVGTAGKSPVLSRETRKKLEKEFTEEWGILTDILGEVRFKLREMVSDYNERAVLTEKVLEAERNLLELIKQGKTEEAKALAFQIIEEEKEEFQLMVDEKTINLIQMTLEEDVGSGDVTTSAVINKDGVPVKARLISKSEGVIACQELFQAVYQVIGNGVSFEWLVNDGDWVEKNTTLCKLKGPAEIILMGERVSLNLMARLSGIATLTRKFVEASKPYPPQILDTRKTTPLWRKWEKYAVTCGGGYNHRFGLYDMFLIKENHIAAAGGIEAALKRTHKSNLNKLKIIIEVQTLDELRAALGQSPDFILLDNFSNQDLKEAVKITAGRIPLEASGGVSLATIHDIAATGVDRISIGSITHSAPPLDFSLLVDTFSLLKTE